jgi:hypothetical protein
MTKAAVTTDPMKVDPIKFEVIRNGLLEAGIPASGGRRAFLLSSVAAGRGEGY